MIRVSQCICELDHDEKDLEGVIRKKLRTNASFTYTIYKKSLDARFHTLRYSYVVDVNIADERRYLKMKDVSLTPKLSYDMPSYGDREMKYPPVVVGFGPAGMFAALLLAQAGFCPIVFERGECVEKRMESVERFWKSRILNEKSNVQYGEGGAGTFSDGKLTSRSKDLRSHKVLEELVNFGADEEILIQAYPHVGSDQLVHIVKNIRQEIIRLGGEIHFEERICGIEQEGGRLKAVISDLNRYECETAIFAIGHSSFDTVKMLHEQGLMMEQKPFAVGVRIEHLQSMINQVQYKEFASFKNLPAAEYRLTCNCDQRGVYTFCMCPGGVVVASTSHADRVVTNGMSYHARDLKNANSAVLVQVRTTDLGDDLFAGFEFQKQLEKKAFVMGGSDYRAPAQLVKDYLENRPSQKAGKVEPTYSCGVKWSNLNELFPSFINRALATGLIELDKKLAGFASDDAVLTGVETRTSSPIRIQRDEKLEASIAGIYPCGEGGGYAGGIVSSAIDGLRCAEMIISKYRKTEVSDEKVFK